MNTKSINNILNNLSKDLVIHTGQEIDSIVWYGSTANGTATEDSDIDVAIIAQKEDSDLWKKVNNLAASYSLTYDCLISIMLISKSRYENMLKMGRLLSSNITRQGKILWQKTV